jgi:hypothetical protein
MSTTLPASAADVLLGRSMNFMRLQLITSCRETERCSRQHRMSSRSLVPAGGYPPDSNKTGEFDNGIDLGMVERVVVARDQLIITLAQPSSTGDMGAIPEIRCPWQANIHDSKAKVVSDGDTAAHNESLIQSVVCSQAWIKSLREEAYDSIEMLAEANGLHPKVVRQSLRFAFLSPDVTSATLEGRQPAGPSLARIPKLLQLRWNEHQSLLC